MRSWPARFRDDESGCLPHAPPLSIETESMAVHDIRPIDCMDAGYRYG